MLKEKLREAYLKAYYGFVEKSAEEIRKEIAKKILEEFFQGALKGIYFSDWDFIKYLNDEHWKDLHDYIFIYFVEAKLDVHKQVMIGIEYTAYLFEKNMKNKFPSNL